MKRTDRKKNSLHLPVAAVFIFILSLSVFADEIEHADVENAIILKNITMESDEFLKDPDMLDGQIIIDHEFDDELRELKKGPDVKSKPSNKKGRHISNNIRNKEEISLIEKLRLKDKRWHLSKYTVRKDDNLWKISRLFDTDHRLIIDANNIKKPDHLLPGRKILIPNRFGISYKIKKGDTLWAVSRKYKITTRDILAVNDVKKKFLRIGDEIFLPDAEEISRQRNSRTDRKYIAKKKNLHKKNVSSRKSLAFVWPLRGKITSGFGTRKDPFSGKQSFHCGIDISANSGTRIRAAENGRVIFSGWKSGYGKVVILRHEGGYISVYAHNSKNKVSKNDRINKGQLIAYSGMTGAVTGAHLHFEIRKYLTPLNPLRILCK